MNKQPTKTKPPIANGHLPIHSREAEEAVLGSLLIDQDAILEIADTLQPEDFYVAGNRDVFSAMLDLYGVSAPHSDPLTLSAELDKLGYAPELGWTARLLELIASVPTSIRVRQYAQIVSEKAARRRMLRAAESIASSAYDEEQGIAELLDFAETEIFDVRGDKSIQGVAKPKQYVAEFLDRFERSRQGGEELGLPTGFPDLDRLLGGLQAPHQYVLASRPAMGKSSLALNIAAHLTVNRNKRVLVFSLEMSKNQIVNRINSWSTGIDSRRRPKDYTEYQVMQLYEAMGPLSGGRLFLDTSEGISPAQIRAAAMRTYAQHGLDLVIIDHLHLLRPDRVMKRSDLEVGEMSWALGNLGKTLNVPILTLAQLSRGVENRQNKRPNLSDMRESGRIEENAYCVMFLYRDDYYSEMSERSNTAEVIVAKHREGPTGTVELYWQPETTSFRSLAWEYGSVGGNHGS